MACLGLWVFGYLGTCPAALTATVTPGHVYTNAERPTITTLNRLGVPTVTINGTPAIAAASITGTMLVDTFAGSNLTWDGSSPRRLVIMNGGVGTPQLASGLSITGTVHFTSYATLNPTNDWGVWDSSAGQYLIVLYPGGAPTFGYTNRPLFLNGNLVNMTGPLALGPGAVATTQGGTVDTSSADLTFATYAHGGSFTNQHVWKLSKNLDSLGSPFTLQHYWGRTDWVSNLTTVITAYTNNSVSVAGGLIHYQLDTFPTNAIPSSSASGTNWIQFVHEGLLRTIATNRNLAGGFLKLVGETVSNYVP